MEELSWDIELFNKIFEVNLNKMSFETISSSYRLVELYFQVFNTDDTHQDRLITFIGELMQNIQGDMNVFRLMI